MRPLLKPEENDSPAGPSLYKQSLQQIRTQHPFNHVLFSSQFYVSYSLHILHHSESLQKFNKFNKSAVRALVITDKFLAKLDVKKMKLLKEPIPIQKVHRASHLQSTVTRTDRPSVGVS